MEGVTEKRELSKANETVSFWVFSSSKEYEVVWLMGQKPRSTAEGT